MSASSLPLDDAADRRLKDLTRSLDVITEDELAALAGVTASTAEQWRKRGHGPSYILFGNRYLYPREAVAEYLQSIVRRRTARRSSPKDML